MVIFYKKWKKYKKFQLTKNKMDLNNRKMTNHPPSPDRFMVSYSLHHGSVSSVIHPLPLGKVRPSCITRIFGLL